MKNYCLQNGRKIKKINIKLKCVFMAFESQKIKKTTTTAAEAATTKTHKSQMKKYESFCF